ncbi:hypothetical protein XENOCAPTIV_004656 [Xenoophorus captivus]|uniref:Uncharacterized protein n=1 Tax=Xenoophorus captivus TaxID=1517983 RepID=A0ABV0RTM6_9TELE
MRAAVLSHQNDLFNKRIYTIKLENVALSLEIYYVSICEPQDKNTNPHTGENGSLKSRRICRNSSHGVRWIEESITSVVREVIDLLKLHMNNDCAWKYEKCLKYMCEHS